MSVVEQPSSSSTVPENIIEQERGSVVSVKEALETSKKLEERMKGIDATSAELDKRLEAWKRELTTYSNILTNMGDPKDFTTKASRILVNAIKTIRMINKENNSNNSIPATHLDE